MTTINEKEDEQLLYSDPDFWFETYQKLERGQEYAFLMRTLERPVPEEFVEELGFAEFVLELPEHHDPAKFAAMVDRLRRYPRYYRKEYNWFEGEMAEYALFLGNTEELEKSVKYFLEDPVKGIDQLLRLVRYLIYYGRTESAERVSREVYETVRDSPELMGGVESDLAECVFALRLQQGYEQAAGEEGWLAIQEEMEREFDFQMKKEKWLDIQAGLSAPAAGGSAPEEKLVLERTDAPERDEARHGWLRNQTWEFCKWMLERHGISFALSKGWWEGLTLFLEDRADKRRGAGLTWESYYQFEGRSFEAYLARRFSGIMSMEQDRIFDLVWGVPFIYRFLLERGTVSKQLYRKVAGSIVPLRKRKLRKAHAEERWKYAFVDRWPVVSGGGAATAWGQTAAAGAALMELAVADAAEAAGAAGPDAADRWKPDAGDVGDAEDPGLDEWDQDEIDEHFEGDEDDWDLAGLDLELDDEAWNEDWEDDEDEDSWGLEGERFAPIPSYGGAGKHYSLGGEREPLSTKAKVKKKSKQKQAKKSRKQNRKK